MKLRILDILKEKGKTKYWLYIQLGLSYQNFNRLVNNQTSAIKFENLKEKKTTLLSYFQISQSSDYI